MTIEHAEAVELLLSELEQTVELVEDARRDAAEATARAGVYLARAVSLRSSITALGGEPLATAIDEANDDVEKEDESDGVSSV